MGLFDNFPYTNFHEINLDQIIKIMRQMQDEWQQVETDWDSMQDFINNYFNNLDVSEEVLQALQTMAGDGELNTIIDPVIVAETASWLAEHITPTSPAVDNTLSIAGAAADAKATGDAVADLKEDINNTKMGITDFELYSHFENYGLLPDGTFETSQRYRVSCENHIVIDRPITVKVKDGFRWGYIPFRNGAAGSWSGWYTSEITIFKDTEFVVQIARTTEDGSEIASVEEFVSAVTFGDAVSYDIENLQQITEKNTKTFTNSDVERGFMQNGILREINARLCFNEMIPIKKGDIFKYKTNILQIAFGVWDAENEQLLYYTDWTTASIEKTYTFVNDGMFFAQFRKTGDQPVFVSDYDANCTLYYGLCYRVDKNTQILNNLSELYPTQFDYEYIGEHISVKPTKYNGEYTSVFMPPNSEVGSSTAQGFAIYNEKIVQMYNPGKAAIIDMISGSVLGICNSNSGHGNTIDFLEEFYDDADDFPKAIASDGLNNRAYEVRVQTTGFTLLKELYFPVSQSGYFASTMIDKLNQLIYTIGYYANSYTNPENNHMVIAKWDYKNLTQNADNSYTPAFISSFEIPFITTLQGPTFYNGLLFVLSSKDSLTDANTTIFVIDPYEQRITAKVMEFDTELQNKETEALFFYNGNGYMKNGDSAKAYYKLTFA